MTDQNFLTETRTRLAGDPQARFAISLDKLAYAKDNHRIGSDLVRTFVRNVDTDTLAGQLAADVATLRHGLRTITGRTNVLGGRYGQLAVAVRNAGGTLFDFETDEVARVVTLRIGAGDADLQSRIAARSAG
ncbi:MAG TPA: hypothetical protein VF867_02975 [Arthrobacter sp.]